MYQIIWFVRINSKITFKYEQQNRQIQEIIKKAQNRHPGMFEVVNSKFRNMYAMAIYVQMVCVSSVYICGAVCGGITCQTGELLVMVDGMKEVWYC